VQALMPQCGNFGCSLLRGLKQFLPRFFLRQRLLAAA
jgi:hypothetical protein